MNSWANYTFIETVSTFIPRYDVKQTLNVFCIPYFKTNNKVCVSIGTEVHLADHEAHNELLLTCGARPAGSLPCGGVPAVRFLSLCAKSCDTDTPEKPLVPLTFRFLRAAPRPSGT
jgi:hypothetical protein